MTPATCHCGAVTVTPARRPAYMFDCNCSLCMKAGALWGYYKRSEVEVSGRTSAYTRSDRDDPKARINFCPACGATTHFEAVSEDADVTGVNMRLYPPADLGGIETRFPDGRAWSGEGDWTYYREPQA